MLWEKFRRDFHFDVNGSKVNIREADCDGLVSSRTPPMPVPDQPRVVHWERIASRWRLAFSHLVTGILRARTGFSGSRFHPNLVCKTT
jgi:hypothetical protein